MIIPNVPMIMLMTKLLHVYHLTLHNLINLMGIGQNSSTSMIMNRLLHMYIV